MIIIAQAQIYLHFNLPTTFHSVRTRGEKVYFQTITMKSDSISPSALITLNP